MRYQFGDFEIATERYELRRKGIVLHAEPLVFDLILYLSRHPGRVVSRDEIVAAVWQGRLVSEATVDGCIKSARRILGDSGDSQSYIRTMRGRGFEFAVPVTAVDERQSNVHSLRAGTVEPTGQSVVKSAPLLPGRPPRAEVSPYGTVPRPVLAVFPFANQNAESDDYF